MSKLDHSGFRCKPRLELCPICNKPGHLPGVRQDIAVARTLQDFAVTLDQLTSESRVAHLVQARAYCTWLLRTFGRPTSYDAIAKLLHRADHSTAVNLHIRAIALRLTNADFDATCLRFSQRYYEVTHHA